MDEQRRFRSCVWILIAVILLAVNGILTVFLVRGFRTGQWLFDLSRGKAEAAVQDNRAVAVTLPAGSGGEAGYALSVSGAPGLLTEEVRPVWKGDALVIESGPARHSA